MGKWYQLFSYWGFILSILWNLGIRVVSPKLILTTNFLFTLCAGILRLLKRKTDEPSVFFFILLTHVIPAWIDRKSPIDVFGSLLIFTVYLISLRLQGTTLWEQWVQLWNEPPRTIKDYLRSRGVSLI
jgi:hypothetical protein